MRPLRVWGRADTEKAEPFERGEPEEEGTLGETGGGEGTGGRGEPGGDTGGLEPGAR